MIFKIIMAILLIALVVYCIVKIEIDFFKMLLVLSLLLLIGILVYL